MALVWPVGAAWAAPEIAILGTNGVEIADNDSTPSYADGTNYGSTNVAGGVRDHVFTITNLGTTALTISGVGTAGTHAADFIFVTVPASTVPAGGATTFTLRFDPSATGARNGTPRIYSDDANEGTYNFSVTGNGVAPEIDLRGTNYASIASGDTTPSTADGTDFGTNRVSAGFTDRTFTITNAGNATLNITGVTTGGAAAADFMLLSMPDSAVYPSNSTSFTVRFDPSAIGWRTGVVTIANDDADEGTYTFTIHGRGVEPEIALLGTNSAEIVDGDATPAAADGTDFGPTRVFNGLTARTFTITNSGAMQLTLGGITTNGANANEFVVTNAPTGVVAPGARVSFTVVFNPADFGTRAAVIHVASDDTDEGDYDFAVQGVGVEPEVAVRGANGAEIAAGDAVPETADGTDYGAVRMTGGTSDHVFTITNSGTTALNISGVTTNGSHPADFIVRVSPPASIAAGGAATMTVRFDPAAIGARSAVIHLNNDDADESDYAFAVAGSGFDPEIAVLGSDYSVIADGDTTPSVADGTDFESVRMMSGYADNVFMITNSGDAALIITGITTGGTHAADFVVRISPPATLNPGEIAPFTVRFDPSALGARTAVLHVMNDDADEGDYDFAVQGFGAEPEIAVMGTNWAVINDGDTTPSLLDGTILPATNVAGGTVDQTFTITNSGTMELTITNVSFTGTAAADFSLADAPDTVVQPGQATTFTIRCDPSAAGNRNATVHVMNDDSNEADYDFAVRGVGIEPEIAIWGTNNITITDGDVTPSTADGTDFGSARVWTGLVDRVFTITNSGIAALNVFGVSFDGPHAADFSVAVAPPATVNPSAYGKFTVRFDPSVTGVRTATVHVANDDSSEADYDFRLVGTGIEPEVALLGTNSAEIADGDATPAAADGTDFGSARVLNGLVFRTFTITNSGSMHLMLSGVTTSGAAASDFVVTNAPSGALAIGAKVSFTVRFDPAAIGQRDAVIHVASDDMDENDYDFAVTGLGIEPEIAVLGTNGAEIADGDATPSAADGTDFGAVREYLGTASRTFTITNSGSATLAITGITTNGATPADFKVITAPAGSVAIGQTTTFTVQFDPAAVGARTAVFHVNNDDMNEGDYDFAVAGLGVEPEIAVLGTNGAEIADGDATPSAADGTDFGAVREYLGTASRTFTITNSGTMALGITGVTTGGANAADFKVIVAPAGSVAAGQTTVFTVQFDPAAVGARTAVFHVNNDDMNEGDYDFAVQGTGVEPEIAVLGTNGAVIADGDPTPALADGTDFGAIAVAGATRDQVFIVTNSGTLTLSVSGVTTTGANAAEFVVVAPPAGAVAAAGATAFTVRFNPSGLGLRAAVVRVANDDADEADYDFAIQGTGLNSPPTFAKGANQNVAEDCGAQTVVGWATAITDGDPELVQTLTFHVATDNDGLFAVAPAVNETTGTLTFTPAANSNGSATVSVWLTDDGGGDDTSSTQTFTIAVSAVNDPPSFTKGANQSVLEDCGAQTVVGWATAITDGDPELVQALTFHLVTDNAALFSVLPAVNAASGDLTYTPAGNSNGVATVSIWLADDGGGNDTSSTQSFTITVGAVNDAPVFTKGANPAVNEDSGANTITGWATGIGAGAPDEAGQTLTFHLTTDNDGLFAVAPAVNSSNGNLTFAPTPNSNGAATVSIWLSDDGGTANGGVDTSSTQTFTITVNVVNDAPSFTKGASITNLEDCGAQTVVGWATGISKGPADEAGQTLTFHLSADNFGLFSSFPAVDPDTGTLTYTPAANSNGMATVSVWLSDNGGTANGGVDTSSTQTFVIAVMAVNDEPAFTKGASITNLEDCGAQTVAGWATGMSKGPDNESGQTLTFHVTTDNDSLFSALPAVNPTSGNLTYTPAANSNGNATVQVWLTDDGGTANGGDDISPTQTFVIAVVAVNDEPAFAKGASITNLEDCGAQTVVGWATGISKGPADEAGQTLTFHVTTDNDSLFSALPAVNPANGNLTYTPAAASNGTATVSIWLADDGGTANGGDDISPTQTFVIVVTPVNDAPTFVKGASITNLEDCGAQTVVGWATGISPGPPNESGQTLTFHVATDRDAMFSVLPAVDPNTGDLTYTPTANSNGTATVRVWLTDDGGTAGGGMDTSATQTFVIAVTPVNDVPAFTKGGNQNVLEDCGAQTVAGWATGISKGPADEAGQTLTFQVATDNDALFSVAPAVNPASGDLTYMPAANSNGTATVSVWLADDGGTANGGVDTTATQIFTIVVGAVNDEPVFTKGASITNLEDCGAQTVAGWATGISKGPADEAGQTLTFHVTTDNNGLFSAAPAVDAATGDLTYTPAANSNGSATVRVWLMDDGGTANGGDDISPTQTFVIAVTAVNDAPAFTKGASVTNLEDCGAQTVAGWATGISKGPDNESGQTLTFHVTTDNDSLFSVLPAVNPASGNLTYTPAANSNGNATVSVWLTDDGGTANGGVDITATQTFTIAVTAVNDAPTFTKGGNQTVMEDCGAQTVTNWAVAMSPGPADEAGQALTAFIVTTDNDGVFTVLPAVNPTNGTLTYTPRPNSNGTVTVRIALQDDGGTANGGADTSATQTFTIAVLSVNDAPSFTKGGNESILEDAGTQTINGWAQNMSAGPANESSQVLTFYTATDRDSMFEILPTINPATGTLTYRVAANSNGTATVSVWLGDDGGTANGGVDTSATQTFTIAVTAVNDAPTFTKGSNIVVLEDAPAQTISGWATNMSAGPADESGQTLVMFNLETDNNGLFSVLPAVDTATGELTFTPVANSNGTANITITLHDNGGTANGGADTSPPQSFTITITSVNDPPSFTKGANQNVLEDCGAQTVAGWATAISKGPDNESSQTLTFRVTTDNDGLFAVAPAINPNTGNLTYTPQADSNGTATVTVYLQDNGGTNYGGWDCSVTQTFTIGVTPVNDIPVFTRGANPSVNEDCGPQTLAGWAAGIRAGPADEAIQNLTFHLTPDMPSLFSVAPAIDPATGNLTFTPETNAFGATTVTLYLQDDGGTANGGVDTTVPVNFTITINSVNDPPSFTKGADESVLEDCGAQTVSAWATGISRGPANESGQVLTFQVANDNVSLFAVQPAINPTTGNLTYTPAANSNGSAVVTVYLQDNGGTNYGGWDCSVTQTFNIVVGPVNDAPSFTKGGNQTVLEDCGAQSVAGWATAITAGPPNEAHQTLTFNITTDNDTLFDALPAIDSASGELTYTPGANKNGSATVTVRLQDNGGTANGGQDTSAIETFTITVTAVNDPPIFTKGANQTVLEDCGVRTVSSWATGISAGAPDESGQTLNFIVSTDNDSLFSVLPAVNPANGTLTFTPEADSNGMATVTLYLRDNGGTNYGGWNCSVTQTFTITVTAVNDEPSWTKGPDQVILEDAGEQVVSGWATNITAGPANEQHQVLTFMVSTSDNTKFAALPAIDPVSGDLTYTPAENANGLIMVSITLRDDGGIANGGDDTSPSETLLINIAAVNDPPAFTLGTNLVVNEDCGMQAFAAWAKNISKGPPDESGQTLSFILTNNNPTLFSYQPAVDANSGTLIFTPTAASSGVATVSIYLRDSGGTNNGGLNVTATQTFTITVLTVNDPPSFTPGADIVVYEDAWAQTFAGWATNMQAGSADEGEQQLTFIVTNNRAALFYVQPALDPTNGDLTFTVFSNVSGVATVVARLRDDGGTENGGSNISAAVTFTITILPVNDAPSFVKGADQTVFEDCGARTVSGWATALSPGPGAESSQALTFHTSADNPALFGTMPAINPVTGDLTFTPATNANGEATVSVWVTDDGGTNYGGVNISATQTFAVMIAAVNDPPTFDLGSDQEVLDDAGFQTVSAWATNLTPGPPDESNQTLVAFFVSNNNSNLFQVQPAVDAVTGDLTFAPATNETGSAVVTLTLKDDGGTANGGVDTSAPRTFLIRVGATDRDLVVTDIEFSRAVLPAGVPFNVVVTVQNQGTVPADGGILGLWYHRTNEPTVGATGNLSEPVGVLGAGESRAILFAGLAPWTNTGVRTLWAQVDCLDVAAETNENNNGYAKTYTNVLYVPFAFQAVALTNSVYLRWTDPILAGVSNNLVHVRARLDDYPANTGDGSALYTGTNRVYEHTGLDSGQPYFYTIWVSHDGTNFVAPP